MCRTVLAASLFFSAACSASTELPVLQPPQCWTAERVVTGSDQLRRADADVSSPILAAETSDTVRLFFTRNLETPAGYALVPHQATNASGRWEVPEPDIWADGGRIDGAVGDEAGVVHAISPGGPEYLRIEDGVEHREGIPLDVASARGEGIGIDADGRVHALFYAQPWDATSVLSLMTRSTEGVWAETSLEVETDPFPGFAVEPSGTVHVSMTKHFDDAGLVSTSVNGGDPAEELVDTGRGQESTLFFEDGRLSIAYTKRTGDLQESLFWAIREDDEWRVELVTEAQPFRYEGLQLGVDPDGRVVIVSQAVRSERGYDGPGLSTIDLFMRDDSGWHAQAIATRGDSEWSTASAAVTSDGSVHVAFAAHAWREGPGVLYYARRQPFGACTME